MTTSAHGLAFTFSGARESANDRRLAGFDVDLPMVLIAERRLRESSSGRLRRKIFEEALVPTSSSLSITFTSALEVMVSQPASVPVATLGVSEKDDRYVVPASW
jgi:hypothetical protein